MPIYLGKALLTWQCFCMLSAITCSCCLPNDVNNLSPRHRDCAVFAYQTLGIRCVVSSIQKSRDTLPLPETSCPEG